MPSPSPGMCDLLFGISSTANSDCLQYLNIPYLADGSQDIAQGFAHDDIDILSDFVDPLSIIQDTPRDPNFLTVGTLLQTSNSNLEMLEQDGDDTRWLTEATASNTQPQSHQVPDRQLAIGVSEDERKS
ncbi:hypothetical protein ACHAQD_002459 [Fusarium lateritium]